MVINLLETGYSLSILNLFIKYNVLNIFQRCANENLKAVLSAAARLEESQRDLDFKDHLKFRNPFGRFRFTWLIYLKSFSLLSRASLGTLSAFLGLQLTDDFVAKLGGKIDPFFL